MDDNRNEIRKLIMMLYNVPGIGWHTIDKAIKHRLWTMDVRTVEAWISIGFRLEQAQKFVNALARENSRESVITSNDEAITALTPCDDEFPVNLQQIAQPPWVLYAKGRLELLNRPIVAIVGTRLPTAYGREIAGKLAQELSDAGVTIVSGLARGIDSKAHEAALNGAGGTIAVLPTPIDTCYPPQNLSLYRSLHQRGLVISETPIGTKLHPGQFHQRNRIIAGLACATIVIEGAEKSGSMITAKFALESNRELFAVPGPITSPKSEGPHALIRDEKARIITKIDDLFHQILWLRESANRWSNSAAGRAGKTVQGAEMLKPEEEKLLRLIRDRSMSIDELHERSGIPFGHLNAHLLNLCIKRKIGLQPGSIYMIL
ncbi:DNA-processing protein DprA [Paenibacillus sp. strain BS8-2]